MPDDPTPAPPPARAGRPLAVAAGLAALMLAGTTLAVLPHLLDAARGAPPTYLADTDQLLYMGWSRAVVLDGSARLVDAVAPGPSPMMHPWALFVPAAWLASAAGLGPMGLAILWRLLSGAGIALGLYAALRPVDGGHRAVALALAGLLLFDAGFLLGQPLVRSLLVAFDLARGTDVYFEATPRVMPHLRVVPPALVLPFLLLSLGLTTDARLRGTTRSAVLAGIALGLLFHVYLYFWTVVLGGLILAVVLDPKGRRTFPTVIALGALIGAPAVIAGARIKAATPPDWLHRTEKFVPIGRFEELLFPKMLILVWLASAWVVFRRRRELIWVWCVVGAGLACTNHQVISRLQIENFHWLLGTGVAFSVLLAALAAPGMAWLLRRPGGPVVLAVVLAAQLGLGSFLRIEEVRRSRESNHLRSVLTTLRADGFDALPAGSVVAGEPNAAMILAALGPVYPLSGRFPEFAARVTDAEFDERLFLDLYLRGITRDDARRAAEAPPGTLSWESLAVHSPGVAARQRARRLELVDRIWTDPEPALDRYKVTHVLVPRGNAPLPDRLVASRRDGQTWELLLLNRPRSDAR